MGFIEYFMVEQDKVNNFRNLFISYKRNAAVLQQVIKGTEM
jgi:hypothetical protein